MYDYFLFDLVDEWAHCHDSCMVVVRECYGLASCNAEATLLGPKRVTHTLFFELLILILLLLFLFPLLHSYLFGFGLSLFAEDDLDLGFGQEYVRSVELPIKRPDWVWLSQQTIEVQGAQML